MKCPSCGSEDQGGKFCAECGAALAGACPSCGTETTPGARFCTACGDPLAGGGRRSHAAWYIAGVAVLVVLLVLFLPRTADRVPAPPVDGAGMDAPFDGAGSGAGPGGLSGDMRTNADRLFNRIMVAAEQGDRSEVERFMPMAIQAYELVGDLDDDGLYHLAILHFTAGQHDEARGTAQRILDRAPGHLLALGVAGAAAADAGDEAAARAYYRRLLDAYAAESARPLPEYVDHALMLTEYRRLAREYPGES